MHFPTRNAIGGIVFYIGFFSVLCLVAAFGQTQDAGMAPDPSWYVKSFIHSHHSTGRPGPAWERQIELVKPDAVEFHGGGYDAGKQLSRKFGFQLAFTLSRSGEWRQVEPIIRKAPGEDRDLFSPRLNPDGTPTGRLKGGELDAHFCFYSPGEEKYIIPVYAETTRKYHPSQIWIDHTAISVNLCYCHFCRENFKKLYGAEPPEKAGDPLWDEWVTYQRKGFERWMRMTCDAVHAVDPNTIVTFNHAYFLAQPEPPPSFIQNLSADIHSQPLSMCIFARYASTVGAPFDIMPGLTDHWGGKEPKTEQEVLQAAAIITANGGRWNIGEFPMSPEVQPADKMLELAESGAKFIRARQDWTRYTEPAPLVAVLQSASTQYARVIPTEHAKSSTEGEYIVSTSGEVEYVSRDALGKSRIYWYDNQAYPRDVMGACEALLENNIHFDVINESTLKQRLSEYKLLVVADQFRLDDETVATIGRFVEDGGGLIASGRTIESGLAPLLGVKAGAGSPADEALLQVGRAQVSVPNPADIEMVGAEVEQLFDGDQKRPAVTRRDAGKGVAIYLAGDFFRAYTERSPYTKWSKTRNGAGEMRRAVGQFVSEAAPRLGYACDGPPWLEVALRTKRGDLLVQLIDRSFEWRNDLSSVIAPVELTLALGEQPKAVVLQPGARKVDWEWLNGALRVTTPFEDVQIHSIVEIKGGAGSFNRSAPVAR